MGLQGMAVKRHGFGRKDLKENRMARSRAGEYSYRKRTSGNSTVVNLRLRRILEELARKKYIHPRKVHKLSDIVKC